MPNWLIEDEAVAIICAFGMVDAKVQSVERKDGKLHCVLIIDPNTELPSPERFDAFLRRSPK